jgi:hypothetical protein
MAFGKSTAFNIAQAFLPRIAAITLHLPATRALQRTLLGIKALAS